MALAVDMPGELNFRWYSRNPHAVAGSWPASVEGRTFEVRIDDQDDPIAVTVDGATVSWSVPAIDRHHLTQDWSFVETTSNPDGVTLFGGKIFWGLGYDDSDDVEEFTVVVRDGDIDIVVGFSSEVTLEGNIRAAADTGLGVRIDDEEDDRLAGDAAAAAALAAHAADTTNIHGIADTAQLETVTGSAAKVAAAITAIKGGVGPGGDTLSELDARLAVVEALGSLATDADLVAAVLELIGSADTAGDTLGELQALIGNRLLKSANLSDVPSPATALANLGGQPAGTYLTPANIDDTAYDATSWNADTTHAPSKNTVRDKVEALSDEIAAVPTWTRMTQAEFAALSPADPTLLYVLIG